MNYDSEIIDLLFDLCQVLFLAYNDELNDNLAYSYSFAHRNIIYSISIPSGRSYREKLLKRWISFCKEFIVKAMEHATISTCCSLQVRFNNSNI